MPQVILRRAPHEVFLIKGVPFQISSSYKLLKIVFQLQEFQEHLFRFLLIFTTSFENFGFNLTQIYVARHNELKYSFKLVIYTSITIFILLKRCSSSDSSYLDEPVGVSQLQKQEHPFVKLICLNLTIHCIFQRIRWCYVQIITFLKLGRGVPFIFRNLNQLRRSLEINVFRE